MLNLGAWSFSQLKSEMGVTDGNLDSHLRKFGAAGYLHSEMITEGRPHTIYRLSPRGKDAFARYLADLKRLIAYPEGRGVTQPAGQD